MLKNQDVVPEPPVSVAQARVTPDELAKALAAIEARRQADAAHLAETIPIEQAVSDLHLDSTSDEIWAEVQAQRAKAVAPPKTASLPPQALTVPRPKRRRRWRGLAAAAVIFWALSTAGIIPHFWNHIVPRAAPSLRPLVTVADGTEVYADGAALLQISEGKPAAQISVSENMSGNRWTVFSRGGHVYLRGYIENASSLQALAGKPLNVYNDDNSGELESHRTSNVTLRVDNVPLQKSGGGDDYSGITIPNFQPDPFTTLTAGR